LSKWIRQRRALALVPLAALLSACAASGAPSPTASSGDYIAYSERIDLVVACVRDHGFEASSYEGVAVYVEYEGPEQEEVATRIEGECWEEVEQRFPAPPELSLEAQYAYLVDVAQCLRDLGHDIPEAPSLETYTEQMTASAPPSDLWDPYYTLSQRGVDIYEIQAESCPPNPWQR
jgi:tRNA pseudouridine-54 N-methylase